MKWGGAGVKAAVGRDCTGCSRSQIALSSQVQPGRLCPLSPKLCPTGYPETHFGYGRRIAHTHRRAILTPGLSGSSVCRDPRGLRPAVATARLAVASIPPSPPFAADNAALRALARIQLPLIYIFPGCQTTPLPLKGALECGKPVLVADGAVMWSSARTSGPQGEP